MGVGKRLIKLMNDSLYWVGIDRYSYELTSLFFYTVLIWSGAVKRMFLEDVKNGSYVQKD